MTRVAVFGGTSEGRILAGLLLEAGAQVSLFVATSYGEELIPDREGLSIICGRLDSDEMQAALESGEYKYVVDATHPYADEVTKNLISAANRSNVPYLRVIRTKSNYEGEIEVESAIEAVRYLNNANGNILLTTGSNTLDIFTGVKGWQERLYARVLPDAATLDKCTRLGYKKSNLICMQGPFSAEMNEATIRMYDISILVTKDSGEEGGFPEKLLAARTSGAELIVIRRPAEKSEGVSLEAAMDILINDLRLNSPQPTLQKTTPLQIPQKTTPQYPRFPIYIPLENRTVLIVGGGKIAARRARVLLDFGALVTVVSPEICDELQKFMKHICWKQQLYNGIDQTYTLVIAATDDRNVNKLVGENAKALGIYVSVADRKEESTFWFPAIAKGGGIVAGLTSETGDHSAVKAVANEVRKVLDIRK